MATKGQKHFGDVILNEVLVVTANALCPVTDGAWCPKVDEIVV